MGPTKKCRTMSESANTAAITLATSASAMAEDSGVSSGAVPSAPPLPTISENEEEEPLLEEDFSVALLEDDQRDFEAGMVVSTSKSGQKINCCDQLLKQCLELIDR